MNQSWAARLIQQLTEQLAAKDSQLSEQLKQFNDKDRQLSEQVAGLTAQLAVKDSQHHDQLAVCIRRELELKEELSTSKDHVAQLQRELEAARSLLTAGILRADWFSLYKPDLSDLAHSVSDRLSGMNLSSPSIGLKLIGISACRAAKTDRSRKSARSQVEARRSLLDSCLRRLRVSVAGGYN